MKKLLLVPLLAFSLAACESATGVVDRMLDAKENIEEAHIKSVVERVKTYCALATEELRERNKQLLDLGNGEILEVHCDRLPE